MTQREGEYCGESSEKGLWAEEWKSLFSPEIANSNCFAGSIGDNARTFVEHGLQLLKPQCPAIGCRDIVGASRLGDQRDSGARDGHDLDDPAHQLVQYSLDGEIGEHGASEVAQYVRELPFGRHRLPTTHGVGRSHPWRSAHTPRQTSNNHEALAPLCPPSGEC